MNIILKKQQLIVADSNYPFKLSMTNSFNTNNNNNNIQIGLYGSLLISEIYIIRKPKKTVC